MRLSHLTAAALAAALALPAAAQDALTPEQEAAVDARIRAYLLENPEIVMEALEELDARRQAVAAANDAELIAANADALFEDAGALVLGNPEGDVTLVEFSDYRCGYCKAAFPQLLELLESDGNIRVVLKEFPILGPDSLTAARAALAASRIAPELYRPFHDAMMEHRGALDEAAVFRLAERTGLDPADLRAAMADASTEIDAQIRATYDLARALGIEGTPSFVIGDRILRGLVPMDQMRVLVEEARADQG
jgi:protein-disulfide isomerase